MTDTNHPLNVDLHCHSNVSDGVLGPDALARRAHDNGVQVWSLTDHDELSGLTDAGEAARALGMVFIPGVEISATWAGQTVHVVGLNINPEHSALRSGLAAIRADRLSRAGEMAQRLDVLGIQGAYDGALRYAGNPELISRTHFARFMVDRGVCTSMQDAFDRYLGGGKPAYVRVRWASLADAVSWILQAGGRAVLAHPGRYVYTATQFDALFDDFQQLGGQGIEVVTGSHRPAQYRQYADVARHYGFLASRGSDFHAPKESHVDLGGLPPLPAGLTPVWHDWI
ncbi:MAG: PHP domain-containing protein [Burkholderiaceae bacterium]|nr:MAG: PHP domain-containing protein [Burkholderiaceae bacterium]